MYVGGFGGRRSPSLSRSRNCILPTRNCATRFCPIRRDHFFLTPALDEESLRFFFGNILNPSWSTSDLTFCVPAMSDFAYLYITFTEEVLLKYYCLNTYAKWRFSYSFSGFFSRHYIEGHAVKRFATSQKITGSIPFGVIGIFH